jgi:hypothetical protein
LHHEEHEGSVMGAEDSMMRVEGLRRKEIAWVGETVPIL